MELKIIQFLKREKKFIIFGNDLELCIVKFLWIKLYHFQDYLKNCKLCVLRQWKN